MSLINGFRPSAEPEPDRFDIITFDSAEGGFDTDLIDLGSGLFFEVTEDGEEGTVALVTTLGS